MYSVKAGIKGSRAETVYRYILSVQFSSAFFEFPAVYLVHKTIFYRSGYNPVNLYKDITMLLPYVLIRLRVTLCEKRSVFLT